MYKRQAQIPSLLLSLATAIVVTRVTTSESMTTQASTQLGNPLALIIAGGIIILLGLVPGMPSCIFLTLGIAAGLAGYFLSKSADKKIAEAASAVSETIKENDVNKPFRMQVASLAYDDYLGRQAIGRVVDGSIKE